MTDSTKGKDGAKEIIMDYVISWALRNAQNICKNENPILYNYCRRLLSLLLNKDLNESDEVTVETWKQFERIDLWVYVTINGEEHDILIEDKYYSPLHGNQLNRYKIIFDDWLKENRPHSNPHYILLSCMESYYPKISIYENPIFRIIAWDEMIEAMGCDKSNPSGSDIFDEFFIYW